MPCYLFTFHAYGSWLPDRLNGFVCRDGQGIHKQDVELGQSYRQQMTHRTVVFDQAVQQCIIDALHEATNFQQLRLHGVAMDPSHVHLLVSWKDEQTWHAVRKSLKRSLTQHLNQRHKQDWFSRSGSRKRVSERSHFDRLMNSYLPKHRGLNWFEK